MVDHFFTNHVDYLKSYDEFLNGKYYYQCEPGLAQQEAKLIVGCPGSVNGNKTSPGFLPSHEFVIVDEPEFRALKEKLALYKNDDLSVDFPTWISYMLCALGDGRRVSFTLNTTTLPAPSHLRVLHMFAALDRPTVLYNVSLKKFSIMWPYSAAFPNRIYIAAVGRGSHEHAARDGRSARMTNNGDNMKLRVLGRFVVALTGLQSDYEALLESVELLYLGDPQCTMHLMMTFMNEQLDKFTGFKGGVVVFGYHEERACLSSTKTRKIDYLRVQTKLGFGSGSPYGVNHLDIILPDVGENRLDDGDVCLLAVVESAAYSVLHSDCSGGYLTRTSISEDQNEEPVLEFLHHSVSLSTNAS